MADARFSNPSITTSLLYVFIAALATLLACSCTKTRIAEAEDFKSSDITAVTVAKATFEDISRRIVLTAEFRPYQEIDVMAKIAGYVKKVYVDVGDRVHEGQVLALIEVPEMADDQAKAQSVFSRSQAELARSKDELQRAESSHKIAHLSYTRLSDVAKEKQGLVAQQEIDDAPE